MAEKVGFEPTGPVKGLLDFECIPLFLPTERMKDFKRYSGILKHRKLTDLGQKQPQNYKPVMKC